MKLTDLNLNLNYLAGVLKIVLPYSNLNTNLQ